MNEKRTRYTDGIIRGMSYATALGCFSAESFSEQILKIAKSNHIEENDPKKKISMIIEHLRNSSQNKTVNQKIALQILLQKDMENVSKLAISSNYNPEKDIQEHYDKFIKILKKIDLETDVKIFLVEKFPQPYHDMQFNAMQLDIDDKKNFGLTPGIYFRKDRLAPFLSVFILAHELAHSCLGKVYVNRLARGFEEGLADIFALYLCSKFMKFEILKNILVNMRNTFQQNQNKLSYADSLRQAFVFHQLFGIKGVLELLKIGQYKGRIVVKKIEEKILNNKWEEISIKGNSPDFAIERISRYYLSHPYSLVCSPLALYTSSKLKVQSNVENILRSNKIDKKEGTKAIKELQDRVYMVVTNNGKVFYNESDLYLRSRTLHYEL